MCQCAVHRSPLRWVGRSEYGGTHERVPEGDSIPGEHDETCAFGGIEIGPIAIKGLRRLPDRSALFVRRGCDEEHALCAVRQFADALRVVARQLLTHGKWRWKPNPSAQRIGVQRSSQLDESQGIAARRL